MKSSTMYTLYHSWCALLEVPLAPYQNVPRIIMLLRFITQPRTLEHAYLEISVRMFTVLLPQMDHIIVDHTLPSQS
jgi:hypothetical protein